MQPTEVQKKVLEQLRSGDREVTHVGPANNGKTMLILQAAAMLARECVGQNLLVLTKDQPSENVLGVFVKASEYQQSKNKVVALFEGGSRLVILSGKNRMTSALGMGHYFFFGLDDAHEFTAAQVEMMRRRCLHAGEGIFLICTQRAFSFSEVYAAARMAEEGEQTYDSTAPTLQHIKRVNQLLIDFSIELLRRACCHDNSKLENPEKYFWDLLTPKLNEAEYGSDEYKEILRQLGPAIEHHYKSNSHHPEYYENGVDGMDLHDLVEMFLDWKAASERREGSKFADSLSYSFDRFGFSEQLRNVYKNTAARLGWE